MIIVFKELGSEGSQVIDRLHKSAYRLMSRVASINRQGIR